MLLHGGNARGAAVPQQVLHAAVSHARRLMCDNTSARFHIAMSKRELLEQLGNDQMSAAALSCRLTDHFAASCAVLDESAQTLFLTEMFRGLGYTLKSFFDPKVTVSSLLPSAVCTMSVGHLDAALRCTGFEVSSAVNLLKSWLRSRACTESLHGRLTQHTCLRADQLPL